MKDIFFTADTHFNQANIIRFCGRPFADITEMNSALIEKWRPIRGTPYIMQWIVLRGGRDIH